MNDETILELLCGTHFDMPERFAKGIWPHPPLKLNDIVQLLAAYLREHDSFPPSRSRVAAEGGTIQRLGANQYVYTFRSSDPLKPHEFTHIGERVFASSEDAARHFLHWDLHLPGDLDGWKVIE